MEKQQKKELVADYKARALTGCVYAVKNTVTGKLMLYSAADIKSARNRFDFTKNSGLCLHPKMDADFRAHGASSFIYEELETLEKGETQTDSQFKEDLKLLQKLWAEKFDKDLLY